MASVNKKFAVEKGLEVGDDALVVDADGKRTGIGKTDPKYGLDVASAANFDGVISANQVGIGSTQPARDIDFGKDIIVRKKLYDVQDSAGANRQVLISVGTGISWSAGADIDTDAAGQPTQIQYNAGPKFGGADNFVFDSSNSRVGIGSTLPEYLLDVKGETRIDGVLRDADNAVGAAGSILSSNVNGELAWVGAGASTLNIIYVTEDGDDDKDGRTNSTSKRTIEGAIGVAQAGDVIRVSGGIYYEDNPVFVPRNVTIDGDDLRNTQVIPKNKRKDLFHVNNGVLIQNMSFVGAANTGAIISFPPQGIVNNHRFVSATGSPIVKTSWNSGVSTAPIAADYDPTSGILTCTTENPHGLSAPSVFSISTAAYNSKVGILTLTTPSNHGISVGEYVAVDNNALTFRCAMDGYVSNHTYPRGTDPFGGKYATVTGTPSTTTLELFVGKSEQTTHTVTNATYEPTTGEMELTIGSHSLTAGESIKLADSSITLNCNFGAGGSKSYPRTTIDSFQAIAGTTYDPVTGVIKVKTNIEHGKKDGDFVKFEDGAVTFTCLEGGGNHNYPRSSDFASGKYIPVSNVTADTFEAVILDSEGIPSTNQTDHTFVSGVASAVKFKRDRAYDQPIEITNATDDSIFINVGISTITNTHTFVSATGNGVIAQGEYEHSFIKSTGSLRKSNDVVGITTNALTFTCEQDKHSSNHTYPRPTDHVAGIMTAVTAVADANTFTVNIGDAGSGARYVGLCTQSPYVRNCTNFVPDSVGMRIDGNHQEGIKSMVVDSYTQYNQGGIGVTISNDGYAQLVSIFTVCDEAAITCVSGGQCDVNNSNASFGTYGLIASGVGTVHQSGSLAVEAIAEDNQVVVSGISQRPYTGQVFYIGELFNEIVEVEITNPGSGYTSANPPKVTLAAPNGPGGITAEGVAVISGFGSCTAVDLFATGSQYRGTPTVTFEAPGSGITATGTAKVAPKYYTINSATPVTAGVSTITVDQTIPANVGIGSTVPFARQSLILASSYTFEYIGAGLTIGQALPKDGGVTIPANETVSEKGGRVVYTSTDERGNLKVGDGFTINQQTGTVTGDAFNKSIQATLTPLIIALGGGI